MAEVNRGITDLMDAIDSILELFQFIAKMRHDSGKLS